MGLTLGLVLVSNQGGAVCQTGARDQGGIMDSFYGPVTGKIKSGDTVSVRPGDHITGTDVWGKEVSGKVFATHPYYPSVTIDGLGGVDEHEFREGRYTVYLSAIDTVVEPQVDTLVGATFGRDR